MKITLIKYRSWVVERMLCYLETGPTEFLSNKQKCHNVVRVFTMTRLTQTLTLTDSSRLMKDILCLN